MRYTTAEKEAMANAIKNNDYATYKRYLPSAYSEDAKQRAFINAGGTISSAPSTATQTTDSGSSATPTTTTPTTTSTATTENEGGVETTNQGFSAKYQGNDFLQWYKANYGSDYNNGSVDFSGLSDVNRSIGNNLYNYYQLQQQAEASKNQGQSDLEKWYQSQQTSNEESYNKYLADLEALYGQNKGNAESNYAGQSEAIGNEYSAYLEKIKNQYDSQTQQLLAQYQQTQEALDKNKANSQQSASITLDKLKKYLPTQIKAQGLGGLGVSESTMLQAYNNYNNQMGNIESDYGTQKSTIDSNYNTNKASYDNTYNDSVSDIGTEKAKKLSEIETNKNSTLASLLNEYSQNKSQAELDKMSGDSEAKLSYDSKLAELLQNYSDSMSEYQLAAGEGSQSLYDSYKTKYEAQQEQLRQEELAKNEDEKTLVYNEFMGRIELGVGYGYNTTYELERDYKKIKNSLTTAQQQLIEGRIQTLKNSAASKQSDSDWYRNSFYKDGNVISQENAEAVLLSIKNDSSLDSSEKSRYQAAFEELYPNSYYTSANTAKTNSKSQYDLYNALANTNMSKDDLSKVNINTIQTNSPFGKWQMYWYGRDGWYSYVNNGTEYWYKRK